MSIKLLTKLIPKLVDFLTVELSWRDGPTIRKKNGV